jgi:hypothetical protein
MTNILIGYGLGVFALGVPISAFARNPYSETRVPWVKKAPRKPTYSKRGRVHRGTFKIIPTPLDD